MPISHDPTLKTLLLTAIASNLPSLPLQLDTGLILAIVFGYSAILITWPDEGGTSETVY